jgi:DNA-binding NarL/FixJ family response regulator
VIGEASTGQDTIACVERMKPDLLLLDVSMPRMSGIEALREVHRTVPETRTIILSGTLDKSQLLTTIQWGAHGLVPKACATDELFQAMVAVLEGQSWIAPSLMNSLMDALRTRVEPAASTPPQPFGLTRREREVLTFVVQGCANKEIAQRLSVSEGNGQAPPHAHVRQGRRRQPARACTRRDPQRPRELRVPSQGCQCRW